MVIRVATFEQRPAAFDDEAVMAEFRAWMKSQPGFRAGWHTTDAKSGKSLSISVWESVEAMRGLRNQVFPGKPFDLKPDKVELFDETVEF